MVDGKGRDIKLAAVREAYEKRSRDRAPKFRKLFDALSRRWNEGSGDLAIMSRPKKNFCCAWDKWGNSSIVHARVDERRGIVSRRRGVGSHITEFDGKDG
jgi:hypothetical protein